MAPPAERSRTLKEITQLRPFDELCQPTPPHDIDTASCPSPRVAHGWRQAFARPAPDLSNPDYNLHFRHMLHVAFRIAAEMGDTYIDALEEFEPVVAQNVTANIFDRHIKAVFL